jgi:head-tail adaptor
MMRQVVSVQSAATSTDTLVQLTRTYTTIGQIAAHVEFIETAEAVDEGGPIVQTTYRLLTAYHPSVDTESRLIWNDRGTPRILEVRTCQDKDQRQRTLEIDATEIVL